MRIKGKVHGNKIISGYDKEKKVQGSPVAILSVSMTLKAIVSQTYLEHIGRHESVGEDLLFFQFE